MESLDDTTHYMLPYIGKFFESASKELFSGTKDKAHVTMENYCLGIRHKLTLTIINPIINALPASRIELEY